MILDSGALVAAERNDRRFWVVFELARRSGVVPLVITPVITEVWRGGPRQARLAAALSGCETEAPDTATARAAGELLGRSATIDPVDALVVATAARRRDVVITGDPGDLSALAAYAPEATVQAL